MPKPDVDVMNNAQNGSGVSTETTVLPRPRRHLSASEKLRIVQLANKCTQHGEVGALLRKEGIYSSQLTQWRRQFEDGGANAIQNPKRGRRSTLDAKDRRIMALEQKINGLENQLGTARKLLEIQKKVSSLFGIDLQKDVENS